MGSLDIRLAEIRLPSKPNPINMTALSCSIRQKQHVYDELRIDESVQAAKIPEDNGNLGGFHGSLFLHDT